MFKSTDILPVTRAKCASVIRSWVARPRTLARLEKNHLRRVPESDKEAIWLYLQNTLSDFRSSVFV